MYWENKDFLIASKNPSCYHVGHFMIKAAPALLPRRVPVNLAMRAFLIGMLSFAFTVVVPGLVAYYGNVFYSEDIRKHLPLTADRSVAQYEHLQSQLQDRITSLEMQIASAGKNAPSSLVSLVRDRDETQQRFETLKPPITMIGFYPSPEFLLFPSIYSSLSWLLFGIKLRHNVIASRNELGWRSLGLALLIYVIYEWPLWVRNFSHVGGKGRIIYSYPNYDVHKGSFFMQELVIFGFAFLIACVWRRWVHEYNHTSREIKATEKHSFYSYVVSEPVTRTFIEWTYSSAIVSIGFLFFTSFYWSLIAKFHDERYLLSAILAHSLWACSWIMVSLPFFSTWLSWNRRRLMEIERLGTHLNLGSAERDVQIKILHELEPISELRLTLANIGAAVSFVFPFLQFLAK